MAICEKCECEHEGKYASGRFCSERCSRSFSTKANRSLINEKISKSLYKGPYNKICANCKSDFKSFKKKQIFCSRRCQSLHLWKNDEYRDKIKSINSEIAFERHKNKDIKFGWQSRKKLNPSYPESIAIRKLNEMDIDFDREVKVGKYFIDFVIGNIGIEIDGQQHKKEERKKSDKEKDKFLNSLGWKIIRIQFPEENIRDKIKEIIGM